MASGLLDAWEIALGDLTESQLKSGLKAAIQAGGEHPPSAGDFRKLCVGNDRPSLEARAAAAFDAADKLARGRGLAASARELNDPLALLGIAACGGWASFCTRAVTPWDRKSFVDAYISGGENPALENFARLQQGGEPVGALGEVRKQLGNDLRKPPADRGEAA